MRRVCVLRALVPVLALVLPACGGKFEGGGDLRARKVVLKREVEGLRDNVARLEKGQPILPLDDVAIAIDDTLLRDLITAQLPFEMDVDRFHLSLTEVEAQFRGSPIVRLRGVRQVRKGPTTPSVSLVISAYNEAAVIRAKLENVLGLPCGLQSQRPGKTSASSCQKKCAILKTPLDELPR